MDTNDVLRITETLFENGKQLTPHGARMLGILIDPSATPEQAIASCFYPNHPITYQEIARGFVGTAARSPEYASRCVSEFRSFFVCGEKYFQITSHIVAGTILGIFETAVWIDMNWPAGSKYDEVLEEMIPDIVWCQNGTLEEGEKLVTDDYRRALTAAIKLYVAGPKHALGKRLGQVANIICEIEKRYEARRRQAESSVNGLSECSKLKLTKVAGMILDGLTYGWFGRLTPIGRIGAINAHCGEIVNQLVSRT